MLGQHTAVRIVSTGAETSLGPTDRIALAYAIVLALLAAFYSVRPPALLVAIAALAAAVVAIARLGSVSRVGRVVHDFAPVAFVPVLYGLSGPVGAAVKPVRLDGRLP